MDAEDALALIDAPDYEHRTLGNGFDPWRVQRYSLSAIRKQGYRKARARKGVEVICQVCGTRRVVHPMMASKALACSECKYRAYRERERAAGRRYWQNWAERAPQRERKKLREAG